MIDSLKGEIAYKEIEFIIIEISGISYQIYIPSDSRYNNQQIGSSLKIFTHLIHKEDIMELYGFTSAKERQVFRFLILVSGIGPRVATKIISVLGYNGIINAILTCDSLILSQVPGLGKKKAEKVIIELETKFKKHYGYPKKENITAKNFDKNALEALLTLGYKETESITAMRNVIKDENLQSTEEIIKSALQILSKNK